MKILDQLLHIGKELSIDLKGIDIEVSYKNPLNKPPFDFKGISIETSNTPYGPNLTVEEKDN